MPDRDLESLEAREAINELLTDILCDDGWGRSRWAGVIKYLRDDLEIETDLLGLVQNAPCLLEMMQIGALARNGKLSRITLKNVRLLIHALVRIAFLADKGDEKSSDVLKALHKITFSSNYEIPATLIKSLADGYPTSPHLARAWSIRSLMLELSLYFVPKKKGGSLLKGPVALRTNYPTLMKSEQYKSLAKYMKRNATLQSIATEIYTMRLAKEGITLDSRQIRDDLKKLREWEAAHPFDKDDYIRISEGGETKEYIPPIPIYSEQWKAMWGRGDKK